MSNQRAQQIAHEIQTLETYYTEIVQQESLINNTIQFMTNSIDALRGIDQSELDVFTPLGPGIYVKAKIKQDDKIVVDIGAGVSIEKDRNSALAYIEMRIKTLQITLSDLITKKQSVIASLENMQREASRTVAQQS